MITYAEVSGKPHVLELLTGMTRGEFSALLRDLTPLYEAAEARRLNRPDRKRAPGGGSKYKYALSDRLLMTLMRLHLRLTTEALGLLFDVDKSTVSRNTRRILPLLQELGEVREEWVKPGYQRGRSLEEAIRECPELASIIAVKSQMGSSLHVAKGGDRKGASLLFGASMRPQPPAGLYERQDPFRYGVIVVSVLFIAAVLLLALNSPPIVGNVPHVI